MTVGFLEVGAGDAFLPALRRAALGEPVDEPVALHWLLQVEDPEFPEALLPRVMDVELWSSYEVDGRRSPVLAARYAALLREATGEARVELAIRLARALGAPPAAAPVFGMSELGLVPQDAVDALLDGRPVDAVVTMLAAHPDEVPESIGLIRDERVAAHLRAVRERRELGRYWTATAELSLMGDADARAEWWEALRIGRYRMVDQGTLLQRTNGLDLSTIPFLIDELRSNCCRVVTHGDGDLVEDLLGVDGFGLATQGLVTPYRRATRIWEEAAGRFAWSRIAERLVPVPR